MLIRRLLVVVFGLMFGLLLVSYTLMSADRYLISMLGPDIRAALGLSLPQMGALTTMFTLGIAIAGLPGGALIARTSRRTVLLLGVALFSVATLLFTQATGFASMFVFIAGATSTGAFVARYNDVRKSSAMPLANLPMTFAVHGATSSSAMPSATEMCSMSRLRSSSGEASS